MPKKIKPAPKADESRNLARYLSWAFIGGLWLLLALALVSYDPADRPGHGVWPPNYPAHNWAGAVGAIAADQLYLMIGPGVWVLMAGALALLVATARQKPITQPVVRALGLVLMSLATSALAALILPPSNLLGDRLPEGAGGLIAIFANTELLYRFNHLGTVVILAMIFWIGAVLAMDQVVMALPKLLAKLFGFTRKHMPSPVLVGKLGSTAASSAAGGLASFWKRRAPDGQTTLALIPAPRKPSSPSPETSLESKSKPAKDSADTVQAELDNEKSSAIAILEPPASIAPADPNAIAPATTDADKSTDKPDPDLDLDPDAGPDAPGAYLAEKDASAVPLDPDALRAKIKLLPINFAPRSKSGPITPREIDLSGYQFPGLDLLEEPETSFTAEMEAYVRQQAEVLEVALREYRIEGEVVGIDTGPVITLFEVRLAPGTKVSALNVVASDLARALMAQNIRVVPNTAGKDTVGVEVPNLKKEKVRLKELMTATPDAFAKMKLPMFLGKDASGNALIQDLAAMPHMLIAGTTGSGKSVCMNSIIMSFLLTKRPDELKLVLVDPKMVEMSLFKDIPHLMCPVVTEMGKAAAILEWATTKMDERYELLAEAGVRDIAGYNSLTWAELRERFNPQSEGEDARIPKKLPYLVFVIDELADMMMTNKEVEGFIVRLAQKARAVGIHLILATQRPQANVVTGLIKGNMPCRIGFKVASGLDSRIVLDQKGAEVLLGQGDMLFLSPRSSKLTRAQGTLVDDLEIRKCVKFLREIAEQNFEPQLVQIRSGEMAVDEEAASDPLFDAAVRCVLETKRGSVSLLQRRLTIGYSRASRLIEAMAAGGILGDYKGSQAREVAITIEEWEALRAQMEKDAAAAAEAEAALKAAESADPAKAESKLESKSPAKSDAKDAVFEKDEQELNLDDPEDEDQSVPDEIDGEYKQ